MVRQNLINARKKANLIQAELALKINVTTRQYQRLEAGTSKGSVEVWEKLSSLFGKSINFLLEQEQS